MQVKPRVVVVQVVFCIKAETSQTAPDILLRLVRVVQPQLVVLHRHSW
jgi:hypothetical protein